MTMGISLTSILRSTSMLAACFCGNANASLRGDPLKSAQRDLEQASDDVTYRYMIDMEEDVAEGGPDDNDNGPSDGVVVCIQKSMASNMNNFAQKYYAQYAQHVKNNETKVRQLHHGIEWAISRILFHQDEEKISMTVVNHDAARLRVFEGDELVTKQKVPLEDHPVDEVAEALVQAAFNSIGPQGKRRRKKGTRRKRRKFSLNIKATCDLCLNDDKDARRALESAPNDGSLEPSFETWMNEYLTQVISFDCEEIMFSSTMFSKEVNGVVTSSSDPSFQFTAHNGATSEEPVLVLTSAPTTSPVTLSMENPTPSPTPKVTSFKKPPPPKIVQTEQPTPSTSNTIPSPTSNATTFKKPPPPKSVSTTINDLCSKKYGSRRTSMCSADNSGCTFYADLGGGKCESYCTKRGGACLSAEKVVNESCSGAVSHTCKRKAAAAICTCTLY